VTLVTVALGSEMVRVNGNHVKMYKVAQVSLWLLIFVVVPACSEN
jgi:hypothetical protein